MTRRLLPIAALTAALLLPAAADAAKRERVLVDRFNEPYAFSVDCADFGPYAFENLVAGTQRVKVVDVFERGELLRTEFHIGIHETDTNSVSGASLPLRSAIREIWEYGPGTRTLSGAVYIGTKPGEGTYVHDTGRITMTLEDRIATFLAGPKEVFFGDLDGIVCAALA